LPISTWERNLSAAQENAALARRLGLRLVTFHAGFLPHDDRDVERGVMLDRLATLQRTFAEHGVGVALETGQESAETLAAVLDALSERGTPVGVNFDPANMILYNMGDPVEAMAHLAPWVRQIHIKDAIASEVPGSWGTEVPVGHGQVRWEDLAAVYRAAGLSCDLVVEREAGD